MLPFPQRKKKEGKRERICCLFSYCLSTNFGDLTKGQNWRKGQFLWISSLEIGCLFTASLLSINRIFFVCSFFPDPTLFWDEKKKDFTTKDPNADLSRDTAEVFFYRFYLLKCQQQTYRIQQMFDHHFFSLLRSLFMYARVHLDSPIKQVYGSLSAPYINTM